MEVGLAFVLLIASGLLIRSFIRIQGVDLGFRTDNLLTMQISLPRSKYPENQVAAFYQRLLHEVESRPGVESAAAISDLPLRPSEHGALFITEGRQLAPGEMAPQAAYRIISPQYFKTMGAALNKGRPFTDQDSEQSPPVVIIDENTARRFWPGEEAVGKRLALTFEKKENGPRWREVVGVVAHIKEVVAEDKGEMQLYVPQLQTPMRSMFLVVRGPAGGGSLMTTTRDALRTVDRDVPAYMAMPMEQVLADSVAPRRFSMLLIGILGAVALTLAIVGLYGVLSYSVTQRTREMGIRMALGAQRSHVIRLVVKQGMGLTLIGILVGLGASLALTHVMSSQLFGVSPTDVTTFVSITLALATAAFLASYLPARRATKVDPVVSLRFE